METEKKASLAQPSVAVKGSTHIPPQSTTSDGEEGGIGFHTEVYCLSKHLGIDSLQALAPLKFEDHVEEQWSGDGFSMAERDGVNRYKQEQSLLEDQGGHPWCPLPTSRARDDILKQLDSRGAIAPAEHVASMSVRFGHAVETQDFLL